MPVEPTAGIAELLDELSLELLEPIPPSEWADWWPWIVSAVIVIALIACFILWILRRKPAAAPIHPAMLAHSRLSRLQTTFAKQSGADYSHAIASILRDYLSDSQIAPAVKLTASEVAANLDKQSMNPGLKNQIVTLLNECDEYRFANAEVNNETRSTLAATTAGIIEAVEANRQPEP